MLSLTAFADELEREKARQRTYDAMLRKARAGHVTGGRVFGYDNVEIARRGRQAVARRAAHQRRRGRRRPADLRAVRRRRRPDAHRKTLNAEGARAPRAQQGRPPAGRRRRCAKCCSASCIAARSSGTRRGSGIAGASSQQTRTARSEWIRVDAPAAADRLRRRSGQAAHARLAAAPGAVQTGHARAAAAASAIASRSTCCPASRAVRCCGGGSARADAERTGGGARSSTRCTSHYNRGPDGLPARRPGGRWTRSTRGARARSRDDVLSPAVVDEAIARGSADVRGVGSNRIDAEALRRELAGRRTRAGATDRGDRDRRRPIPVLVARLQATEREAASS